MQSNQVNLQDLFKLVYRPNRNKYNDFDLGPKLKIYPSSTNQVCVMRKDYDIQNTKQQTLKLSVWRPQNNNKCPIIIYSHGNSGNRLEGLPLVKHAINYKMGVATFDFSGCGISDGDIVTLGLKELEDLKCIIEYIKQLGHEDIILWGRSMGAVTSLLQCSKDSKNVISLIIDSPFSSFEDILTYQAELKMGNLSVFANLGLGLIKEQLQSITGYDYFKLKPYIDAQKIKIPTMIAFSYDDKTISHLNSLKIRENLKGNSEIITFKGDHNTSKNQEFFKTIFQFIESSNQIHKKRSLGSQKFTKVENNYSVPFNKFIDKSIRLSPEKYSISLNLSKFKNTVKQIIENLDKSQTKDTSYFNQSQTTHTQQKPIKSQSHRNYTNYIESIKSFKENQIIYFQQVSPQKQYVGCPNLFSFKKYIKQILLH